MSNLLPFTVNQTFIDGITRRLQPGEQLTTLAPVIRGEVNSVWNKSKDQFEDVYSVSHTFLALSSTSLRVITFGQEKVKRSNEGKNRLGKVINVVADVTSAVTVPSEEINSMTQFSLNSISGVHYSKGTIKRDWLIPLTKSGEKSVKKKSEVVDLVFESSGIMYNFFSLYEPLNDLSRNLDSFISGSVMSSNINRVEDALSRLAALVRDGAITQEEFEASKAGFIGRTEVTQESSLSAIRQLASLYSSGVVSEAEFKAKKFELLLRDNK